MPEYIVHYVKSYGEVKFYNQPKAKCLAISICPLEGAIVRIPPSSSVAHAYKYFCEALPTISHLISRAQHQEQIFIESRKKFLPIDLEMARSQLVSRLHRLAEKHQFKFKAAYVKQQKTRWGSCTGDNKINLNAQLITLPQELCDYVIVHELVHTKIKNHQREFWDELERYIPNAKDLDTELGRDYFIIPSSLAYTPVS
jgi:predicted metal-dependent hydrolase